MNQRFCSAVRTCTTMMSRASEVIGNVDSGKSTLVGVLTKGGLDDGRGLARAKAHFRQSLHAAVIWTPCPVPALPPGL